MITAASATVRAEEFHAPGPSLFDLPGIAGSEVTKPMVQLFLAAILVFGFFYLASRKRALVPGKLQFAGEGAYGFVRNSVARDIIGSHDFQKFVPYLVTVFFFILVNNLFASIPFIQFPTFSRAGMAYALAGLSWLVYNGVGVARHGLLGYLKLQSVPSGVSPVMYRCSSRWSSSPTSWSARSRWPCVCSATCSPATSCSRCSRPVVST